MANAGVFDLAGFGLVFWGFGFVLMTFALGLTGFTSGLSSVARDLAPIALGLAGVVFLAGGALVEALDLAGLEDLLWVFTGLELGGEFLESKTGFSKQDQSEFQKKLRWWRDFDSFCKQFKALL